MNQKLVLQITTFLIPPNIHREGGDIGLYSTLVPKVLKQRFLIKCVTFFYVLLLFGHNLVKNAHKSDLFRPKILKWFLYKPNQSVLRYLYISRKIDENTKKRQIWVLPFICTDTIKSTEKILIFTFLSFLKFDSVKLAILEGIYALKYTET